jgi:hypothetical protein
MSGATGSTKDACNNLARNPEGKKSVGSTDVYETIILKHILNRK